MVRLRTAATCYAADAPESSFPEAGGGKNRRFGALTHGQDETFVRGCGFHVVFPIGAIVSAQFRRDVFIMADLFDDAFYERADAHIVRANQDAEDESPEAVNASLMFASARFSAFVSARGFGSGEEMAAKRDETVEYFVAGFRQMLEGNLDAYISNFAAYVQTEED
jgi:hypothetical protein